MIEGKGKGVEHALTILGFDYEVKDWFSDKDAFYVEGLTDETLDQLQKFDCEVDRIGENSYVISEGENE